MLDRLLEEIRSIPNLSGAVDDSVETLKRFGVIRFLRYKAIPTIFGRGEELNSLAVQAARAAGYNECLDDLEDFRRRFIESTIDKSYKPSLDYGALEIALTRGDITKEEYNAARNRNPEGKPS